MAHDEGAGAAETKAMPDLAKEEESGTDAEKWDRYERFGFHAGDAQKEQLRLERIEYFCIITVPLFGVASKISFLIEKCG